MSAANGDERTLRESTGPQPAEAAGGRGGHEALAGAAEQHYGERARLREENTRLAQTVTELRQAGRELDNRVSGLLAELAEYRRDRSRTYVAGAAQAHLVGEALKVLRDQDLRAVSREVLRLLPRPAGPSQQREAVTRIKASLSWHVLMEEQGRLQARRRRAELQAFADSLAHLPLDGERRRAIAGMVEPELAAAGDRELPEDRVERLRASLALGDASYGDALRRKVEALFAKGSELADKVMHTDPPGRLWVDEPGTPFDEARHEVELGCEEGGVVRWTSHPGFQVDDRVILRATVFTAPGEESTVEPESGTARPPQDAVVREVEEATPHEDAEAAVHEDAEAPVHEDAEAPVHEDAEAAVHEDAGAAVQEDSEVLTDFEPSADDTRSGEVGFEPAGEPDP